MNVPPGDDRPAETELARHVRDARELADTAHGAADPHVDGTVSAVMENCRRALDHLEAFDARRLVCCPVRMRA